MDKGTILPAFLALFLISGCSSHPLKEGAEDPALKAVQSAIAAGNYDEAVQKAKAIASETPAAASGPAALYLEGYAMAYGWGDFGQARVPLKSLLEAGPQGPFSQKAERLLADCLYWEGSYSKAIREYQTLGQSRDPAVQNYASFRTADCLLLRNKVGDALTAYRALAGKRPTDWTADSAQWRIANIYIKLQNLTQAKTELQKLIAATQNQNTRESAQMALSRLGETEPFQKGVGVPE